MRIEEIVTPQLVLVSSWMGNIPPWLENVKENHSAYALRHGYGLDFDVCEHNWNPRDIGKFIHHLKSKNQSSSLSEIRKEPTFQKLPEFMMEALWRKVERARLAMEDKANKFVFLSDCDSVFMNFSIDFRDLIEMNRELIFTGDAWDLFNGGHLFLRNSSFARDFLDLWLSFKSFKFDYLPTTHQSIEGYLSDQPMMNALLGGGTNIEQKSIASFFNQTNGFSENEHRRHKVFPYTHAPTRKWRLPMSRSLIHKSLKDKVGVVSQSRMNSYQIQQPGAQRFKFGDPIIHLVGTKESVVLFCDESKSFNGY